jgi:integrase
MRNSLQTLFNFAKARRYLPKDHDELDAVGVAKDRDGEIEIYSPAELKEILACAPEGLIPFLVLGAFAGIRHAEIQRLEWQDIRLTEDFIEIRAAKAKTASRRTIPILPNLKAWLAPRVQKGGPVCGYQNVSNVLQDLVRQINRQRAERKEEESHKKTKLGKVNGSPSAAVQLAAKLMPSKVRKILGEDGLFEWKRNGLRHSFISYRVADVQDVAKVSLEAGNSPQMIFKHYRELVTPKEAKAWFGIRPEGTA